MGLRPSCDRPAEPNNARGEAGRDEVVVQPDERGGNGVNKGPQPPQAKPRVKDAVSFSLMFSLNHFVSKFVRFLLCLISRQP